jgi:hypothetical protein
MARPDRPTAQTTGVDEMTESKMNRIDDARMNRRHATESKMIARLDRLDRFAEPMIGQLSSGRFYCYPVGGKYFEAKWKYEVVEYLARNRYI